MNDDIGAFIGPPRVLARGASSGPLAGTTLAVKDLFDVSGTVTGAGNPTFAAGRTPARRDAAAVERLVAAGATVVGKTLTDELAYSLSGTNVHYGTPVNVAAPGRIPGGSSAGSAAAVAAGRADLALGTDTGGSIRVPASYCGILGWRSTHGAVSFAGVVPLAPSFDTVGLFARRAELLRRAAATVLDHPSDSVGGGFPRRIVLVTESLAEIDDVAVGELEALVSQLGAAAGRQEIDVDLGAASAVFRTIQGFEAWQCHGSWIESARPRFGAGVAARFAAASKVTAEQVGEARQQRVAIREKILAATSGETMLVVPAAPAAAPPLADTTEHHEAQRAAALRLTCIAGLGGLPVIVAPLLQDDGLPLGVAFIGPPDRDLQLLSWVANQWPSNPT